MFSSIYFAFLLIRPLNVVLGFVSAIVAASIVDKPISLDILLSGITIAFFIGGGNAINDYFDYEADMKNSPSRPIPAGHISRRSALQISIGLFVLGFITTSMLESVLLPIIIAACATILLIEYSRVWKRLPLVGNFIVAILLGLAFIFNGAAIGMLAPMIPPSLLAFGLSLIREMVKDLQDYNGDLSAKFQTFPVVFGKKTAIRTIVIFTIIFILFLPLLLTLKNYGSISFFILVLGVIFPLIFLIFSFLTDGENTSFGSFSDLLKWSTIAGLFSIYFGGH